MYKYVLAATVALVNFQGVGVGQYNFVMLSGVIVNWTEIIDYGYFLGGEGLE